MLPRKRGPRQAHKLTDEVLAVLATARAEDGSVPRTTALAAIVNDRFGITAHPRSIERSLLRYLQRQEKTTLMRSSVSSDSRIPNAHYEALRAQMIGATATAPVRGVGLALLLQQGVPAWLHAVSTCISPSPPGIATVLHVTTSDDHDDNAPLPMPRGPRAGVIPWAQHAEVATLLASLVLSARPPRRDPATWQQRRSCFGELANVANDNTMTRPLRPTEGDTKPCPQCRGTLVFSSHYPVLTVGMALVRTGERCRRAHPLQHGVGVSKRRLRLP